jgi:hypothetical protein
MLSQVLHDLLPRCRWDVLWHPVLSQVTVV